MRPHGLNPSAAPVSVQLAERLATKNPTEFQNGARRRVENARAAKAQREACPVPALAPPGTIKRARAPPRPQSPIRSDDLDDRIPF
jgi:hypothetical protein